MAESSNIANWVITLIQVGIPAFVTIASLVLTFLIAKAGHKKDIDIANLTFQSKVRESTSQKEATLIQEVAEAISGVENSIGKYSGIFRKNAHKASDPINAELQSNLITQYAELSSAIDACCGVRAKVNLLGKPKLTATYELFLEQLFRFQHEANPSNDTDTIKISGSADAIKSENMRLMKLLSSLYLHSEEMLT